MISARGRNMETIFSSRRNATRRSTMTTSGSVYQATPYGTPPLGRQGASLDPLRGYVSSQHSSTCSGSSSWVLWRDEPSSLYRDSRARRGRLCSALLAVAVFLVVLTVLAIAGLSVYMGALRIDTNKSDLVFDGSVRVTSGDEFVSALSDNSTNLFKELGLKYQNMIDRVYQRSQLRPAYKKCIIQKFENGSLVVFFRLYLDRRKIPRNFQNLEETARDILVNELIAPRTAAFKNIQIDATSILIKRTMDDVITSPIELSSKKKASENRTVQMHNGVLRKAQSMNATSQTSENSVRTTQGVPLFSLEATDSSDRSKDILHVSNNNKTHLRNESLLVSEDERSAVKKTDINISVNESIDIEGEAIPVIEGSVVVTKIKESIIENPSNKPYVFQVENNITHSKLDLSYSKNVTESLMSRVSGKDAGKETDKNTKSEPKYTSNSSLEVNFSENPVSAVKKISSNSDPELKDSDTKLSTESIKVVGYSEHSEEEPVRSKTPPSLVSNKKQIAEHEKSPMEEETVITKFSATDAIRENTRQENRVLEQGNRYSLTDFDGTNLQISNQTLVKKIGEKDLPTSEYLLTRSPQSFTENPLNFKSNTYNERYYTQAAPSTNSNLWNMDSNTNPKPSNSDIGGARPYYRHELTSQQFQESFSQTLKPPYLQTEEPWRPILPYYTKHSPKPVHTPDEGDIGTGVAEVVVIPPSAVENLGGQKFEVPDDRYSARLGQAALSPVTHVEEQKHQESLAGGYGSFSVSSDVQDQQPDSISRVSLHVVGSSGVHEDDLETSILHTTSGGGIIVRKQHRPILPATFAPPHTIPLSYIATESPSTHRPIANPFTVPELPILHQFRDVDAILKIPPSSAIRHHPDGSNWRGNSSSEGFTKETAIKSHSRNPNVGVVSDSSVETSGDQQWIELLNVTTNVVKPQSTKVHSSASSHRETISTMYNQRPTWGDGGNRERPANHDEVISSVVPMKSSFSKVQTNESRRVQIVIPKPQANTEGSAANVTPLSIVTLIPVRSNSGIGRPLRPRPKLPSQTQFQAINKTASIDIVLNSEYTLRNKSGDKHSTLVPINVRSNGSSEAHGMVQKIVSDRFTTSLPVSQHKIPSKPIGTTLGQVVKINETSNNKKNNITRFSQPKPTPYSTLRPEGPPVRIKTGSYSFVSSSQSSTYSREPITVTSNQPVNSPISERNTTGYIKWDTKNESTTQPTEDKYSTESKILSSTKQTSDSLLSPQITTQMSVATVISNVTKKEMHSPAEVTTTVMSLTTPEPTQLHSTTSSSSTLSSMMTTSPPTTTIPTTAVLPLTKTTQLPTLTSRSTATSTLASLISKSTLQSTSSTTLPPPKKTTTIKLSATLSSSLLTFKTTTTLPPPRKTTTNKSSATLSSSLLTLKTTTLPTTRIKTTLPSSTLAPKVNEFSTAEPFAHLNMSANYSNNINKTASEQIKNITEIVENMVRISTSTLKQRPLNSNKDVQISTTTDRAEIKHVTEEGYRINNSVTNTPSQKLLTTTSTTSTSPELLKSTNNSYSTSSFVLQHATTNNVSAAFTRLTTPSPMLSEFIPVVVIQDVPNDNWHRNVSSMYVVKTDSTLKSSLKQKTGQGSTTAKSNVTDRTSTSLPAGHRNISVSVIAVTTAMSEIQKIKTTGKNATLNVQENVERNISENEGSQNKLRIIPNIQVNSNSSKKNLKSDEMKIKSTTSDPSVVTPQTVILKTDIVTRTSVVSSEANGGQVTKNPLNNYLVTNSNNITVTPGNNKQNYSKNETGNFASHNSSISDMLNYTVTDSAQKVTEHKETRRQPKMKQTNEYEPKYGHFRFEDRVANNVGSQIFEGTINFDISTQSFTSEFTTIPNNFHEEESIINNFKESDNTSVTVDIPETFATEMGITQSSTTEVAALDTENFEKILLPVSEENVTPSKITSENGVSVAKESDSTEINTPLSGKMEFQSVSHKDNLYDNLQQNDGKIFELESEFTLSTSNKIPVTENVVFRTEGSSSQKENIPTTVKIFSNMEEMSKTKEEVSSLTTVTNVNTETVTVFSNFTVSKVSGINNNYPNLQVTEQEVPMENKKITGQLPLHSENTEMSDDQVFHLLNVSNASSNQSRNYTIMSEEAVNALSMYANVHTNTPEDKSADNVTEDSQNNVDSAGAMTTNTTESYPGDKITKIIDTEEVKASTKIISLHSSNNHAGIPILTKIYNKIPQPFVEKETSWKTTNEEGSIDLSNSTVGDVSACPSNLSLRCGDGECISALSRCNQLVDCNDGADERDCSCADYLRAQFLTRKLCDGIVDCWDFSDENSCEWCSPGQFVCPNSQVCVDQHQLCDGTRDCPYGDDEKQCVTVAQNEATAGDLPYSPEGYLMVRKQGRWGKLCLQNFDNVVARSESTWEVADLGRAVCKAMTYSDFERVNRTIDMPGSSRADDSHYFELAYSSDSNRNISQPRSSLSFQETQCNQKEVVHVSCRDLQCGVRPQAINQWARIVGGGNAAPGSWPWQAALYKEGEFQCGATLIADCWLVSAGHCFYHALDDYWVARLGALRRGSSFPSPYEQLRPVSHIILHPGYVDAGFLNDISLLRLREPVQFSDFVRPVCLPPPPPAAPIRDGRLCTVVGWGQLFEVGRIFPDTLQEVQLPIISTAECRKRTLFLPLYRVTDNMFCAGFDRGGRDACLGDSGGPLMCQEKDGHWSLYGVTSNGYGCARANRPGVYTKVANYVPWLQAAMAQQVSSLRDSKTQCKGHRCPLGECLPPTRVCNGFMECSDGSDEKGCW
ncbi:uncharacterized protein [Periplaneta americana]|uniref:uncharacterized protein isoform X3 n=1 Tax=Periplaneta americana TaxID=6978 RepID=UPI0037E857C9